MDKNLSKSLRQTGEGDGKLWRFLSINSGAAKKFNMVCVFDKASLVFSSCILWLLNFADVFAGADKVD